MAYLPDLAACALSRNLFAQAFDLRIKLLQHVRRTKMLVIRSFLMRRHSQQVLNPKPKPNIPKPKTQEQLT